MSPLILHGYEWAPESFYDAVVKESYWRHNQKDIYWQNRELQ
jgi:hypothetical protein